MVYPSGCNSRQRPGFGLLTQLIKGSSNESTDIFNRHVVAANKKNMTNDPAIAINTYKGVEYCHKIALSNAILIQDMPNPLCSGANIWIECDRSDIVIIS